MVHKGGGGGIATTVIKMGAPKIFKSDFYLAYLQLLFSFVLAVTPNSPIRPIYNIAHMVNSVKQIDTWLGYGSNALEVDVSFSKVGTPEYFYHGTPCDAGRYCERWAYIGNYIEALRERTLPDSRKLNRQLVLVMFDVKLKNVKKNSLSTAGEKFVKEILIPLYKDNPTKMKVTISVPNFTLKNFILAVLSRLNAENPDIIQKIGFEISMEWNLTKSHQKEKALRDLGVPPFHAWLSSGITNWSPKLFLDELSSQVEYRDNGNYFSKVYAWTVDKKSTAKTYLEMGLDGIIMNYPGRMNEAMAEINKRKGQTMRLATLDDDPFELVK